MPREGKPACLAWNTRTLSAAAAVDSSAPWRMEMLGYESTSLTRDSTNPVAESASATPPPPNLAQRAAQTAGACALATCRGEPPPPHNQSPPSDSLRGATTRDGPQCVPPVPALPTPSRLLWSPPSLSFGVMCALEASERFVNAHARSHLIAN